ncbi:ankyrin repeat domain-containing protein [Wolbachia endosymbiont (group A) of Pipizella viduata]|uniref:ankyrin repeat domain-containing protein n=1 Tax=Wolbachia endosymbiont (group A) of Pipizella viduata TaxID=3066154 RepID=UPI00333FE4B9
MTKENSTSSELVHNNELLSIITKKVTKGKHKHLHPEVGKDKTLNKCKGLFKEGASPKILIEVLTKLGESPEEQEKYYKYYTQHFLPALKKEIKQSKKLDPTKKEEIEQVISEAINKSSKKDHPDNVDQNEIGRRGSMESETESGNSSDAEDDHNASKKHSISSANTISEGQGVEKDNGMTIDNGDSGIESGNSSEAEDDPADEKDHISGIPISYTANENQEVEKTNGITNSNVQYTDEEQPIFKAIKNGNRKKFEEYLKGCKDISSAKDEKENNILHLIVTQLEKKQKFDFLNTVLDVSKKEGKEQLKAQLEKAVNDKNGNGQTPLQALLLSKVTKEKQTTPLKKLTPHYDNTIVSAIQLLKLGANIDDLQLSEEKLQYLKEEQKTYYRNFLEKLAEQGKKSKLKPEIKTNTETKIKEIIPYTINTPDSNNNYLLHSVIKNNDKKLFKELLEKGVDISLKDTDGNNALHHVALLKGEQKVAYLELILNLVEKGVISQDKLREAMNATNQKENTPLQVALIKKVEKGKHLSQIKVVVPKKIGDGNTTKFCAMLLKNGADPSSLWLQNPEFHTENYKLTIRNLKNCQETTYTALEEVGKIKKGLEEKYHCKTASKKCQSGIEKAGSFIEKTASTTGKAVSAAGKYIDPAKRTRQTLISITTVIFISAVAYGVSQGYIGAFAALFLAAIAIATCLALTLGFSGVKKCFEKLTNKTKNSTDNDRQTKRARNPKSEMKDTSTKSPADGLTI